MGWAAKPSLTPCSRCLSYAAGPGKMLFTTDTGDKVPLSFLQALILLGGGKDPTLLTACAQMGRMELDTQFSSLVVS